MAKAAIFDFDGTLVDSEPLYDKHLRMILEDAKIDFEIDIAATHGAGIVGTVQTWKKSYPGKADWDEIGREFLGRFHTICMQAPFFPGAVSLLESISGNLPTAICSNSPKKNILDGLAAKDAQKYFQKFIAIEDVLKGKPAPDPYLKACAELGFAPRECVAVEDSTTGLLSAKSAGCKVVIFNSNEYPASKLSQADLVVESWEEITPSLLKEI